MPIVINGTGTVTGLSVGGLPDGCVDSDTLADEAVTKAKQGPGSIVQYVICLLYTSPSPRDS